MRLCSLEQLHVLAQATGQVRFTPAEEEDPRYAHVEAVLKRFGDRQLFAGRRLIQVNANNVVGFKFVRDCAVTYAGDHGCQAFALFHEVFSANWIIETLTDSDIAKLDTAT